MTREASWLIEGISVRVVDERWRGGRYFRRRGVVRDVLAPGLAEVQLAAAAAPPAASAAAAAAAAAGDALPLLTAVPQAVLETALPRVGGRVLVVRGPHRLVAGALLQRDAQSQIVALRREDDGQVLAGVAFDDVAEYAEAN